MFNRFKTRNRKDGKKGFTLIELMISVGIFGIMTALLIAKYGSFNQSVLFTNLAYDVALTIRTAQTYGLSVKGQPGLPSPFDFAYGVHFSTTDNKKIILFATPSSGADSNNIYDGDGVKRDVKISEYTIKRGAYVSKLCMRKSNGTCHQENLVDPKDIDITFIRPDPSAKICANPGSCKNFPLEITLESTDGNKRTLIVQSNGQIAVND